MTKEEYESKRKHIQIESRRKYNELDRNYALSNNVVYIGDFVNDHIGTIKVASIRVEKIYGLGAPQCVYSGVQYTKKGNPFKNGEERTVYQSNLVDHQKG